MNEKGAQVGLFVTGILGIIGAIQGLNDSNGVLAGLSLLASCFSFGCLFVMYYFISKK